MSARRDGGARDGRRRTARNQTIAAFVIVVAVAFAAGWWLALEHQKFSSAPVGGPRRVAPPVAEHTPAPPRARSSSPAAAATEAPRLEPTQRPAAGPEGPPRPRLAIIFDDAGGSLAHVEDIIAIGRPVAIAILPHLAHSTEAARRTQAAGLEVLLHLPVEPEDDAKAMGPGGITTTMEDADIRAVVHSDLDSVPGAVGINNHMGSKGTADYRVMRAILEVVRGAGLFYVDSVTTPRTIVAPVAEEVGVPTAARAVFLDNENDETAIRRQLARAIVVARERGHAIAIGHAQRLTPRVVLAMLPEIDRAGVMLVPVSTLVR
jgi:polysaccharide deacetylase 2 family uncharacterized protein YibQ